MEFLFTRVEKLEGEVGLGKGRQKLSVGHINFEMPIRCLRRGEQQAVGSLDLDSNSKVRAADTNLDIISIEMVFIAMGWTRSFRVAV